MLFHLLCVYVAVEQCRFGRWLRGVEPDVVLEPMPTPEDGVPDVHNAPTVFISADGDRAYSHSGQTLRRCAQNDDGELVYLRKATKKERRALKRAKRQNGHHTAGTA